MNPDFTAVDGREAGHGDVVVTAAAPPLVDAAAVRSADADELADELADDLATRWADPQEWLTADASEAADPAWDAATAYAMGERVVHGGAVFEASWRTRGQAPGASAHGPWQEVAASSDGTASWTRSRIFEPGDVAVHGGVAYVAHWWTRDQEPGDPHGPWRAQR